MRGIFRPNDMFRKSFTIIPKESEEKDISSSTSSLDETSGSGLEQLNPKLEKLMVRPLKKPKNIKINLK